MNLENSKSENVLKISTHMFNLFEKNLEPKIEPTYKDIKESVKLVIKEYKNYIKNPTDLYLIINKEEKEREFIPSFTQNEINIYIKQKDKCKFQNPEEEYLYAKTQYKMCTKCNVRKNLTEFKFNTSGTDGFNKDGYRLRRSECGECTKKSDKGKNEAIKKAKELGISFKPPEGTLCEICNRPSMKGNVIIFDHCHKTNKFRGYCCNSCNRSIGILGDDIDGLLKAFNYILKFSPKKIIQNKEGLLSVV